MPASILRSRCGLGPTTAPLPLGDEASLLTEEIRQLDEAIVHLKERKARASVRLNTIRTPYGNLPDEVLSIIFEHAGKVAWPLFEMKNRLEPSHNTYRYVTYPLDRYFPLHVLGAVCSHWRRVTWSTPSLWSFLDFSVTDVLDTKQGFALPRYYFENAGRQQMTVIVDCRLVQESKYIANSRTNSRTQDCGKSLSALRDLIFLDYPQKIAHLRLNSPPPEWLPLLSKSFVNLKGIELGWSNWSKQPSNTTSLAGLCSQTKVTQFPWEQVTHLELVYTSFELAVQLLISCPNLTNYGVQEIKPILSSSPVPWLSNNQVALPHLKTFRWMWRSCNLHAELLDLLHLPSLQHLYWYENAISDKPEVFEQYSRSIASFLSKLPAHQLQLHLCRFGLFRLDDVKVRLSVLLKNTRGLKHLNIHEPIPVLGDTLSAVVAIIRKAQQEGRELLPELKRVSLTGHVSSNILESSNIVTLMRERKALGMTGFRLDVPHGFRPGYWSDADCSDLKAMGDQGGFRIFEEGKMVSWYWASDKLRWTR